MAYPSLAECKANADGAGVYHLWIEAFAAWTGQLPQGAQGLAQLQSLQQKVHDANNGLGWNEAFMWGFVEATGQFPANFPNPIPAFEAYLNHVGARNADGSPTMVGNSSWESLKDYLDGRDYPAQWAPPGATPAPPPTTGGTGSGSGTGTTGGTTSTSLLDQAKALIEQHPLEAAAVGAGVLLLLVRR